MAQWGWGYVCGGEKQKEKKMKRKVKETYERKESKKIKKSQLNDSTIRFSQYFTINIK